jgi:hypothetical protein
MLLLLSTLLPIAVWAYTGDPIVRDGIGSLQGYSGTVYQAVRFVPVCGTLDPSLTTPWDMTQDCVPAMSIYNRSLDLLSFYDQTGVRLSQAPGSGTAGCMCFSLGKAGGSGGNFCVWISGFAQPEIVYSQPEMGYYVAGSYQPGGKALP